MLRCPKRSGRRCWCCSATRSTPTTRRPSSTSAVASSNKAASWPAIIARNDERRTRRRRRRVRGIHVAVPRVVDARDRALGAVGRAEHDDLRRPRHDRRLEHQRQWVDDIRSEQWWHDHVVGGLMSYFIYQHLGNLSPKQIAEEGILAALHATGDGDDVLRGGRSNPSGSRRCPAATTSTSTATSATSS